MFLAQVLHEPAGLTVLSENLSYSASRLRAVFPRYFPTASLADQYDGRPEAIASRVYADRMGNGAGATQDGWTYRGAGAIQMTGRDNHAQVVAEFNVPLAEVGDWMRRPYSAAQSAAWYWRTHGCNAAADRSDITACTRVINGGLNGLESRRARWIRVRKLMELS
jgi:putative chitinase